MTNCSYDHIEYDDDNDERSGVVETKMMIPVMMVAECTRYMCAMNRMDWLVVLYPNTSVRQRYQ